MRRKCRCASCSYPWIRFRCNAGVERLHSFRSGAICTIRGLPVDRRDSIESGSQMQEVTESMVRCRDFRRDDYRISVRGKHKPSDDPCLCAAACGPPRRGERRRTRGVAAIGADWQSSTARCGAQHHCPPALQLCNVSVERAHRVSCGSTAPVARPCKPRPQHTQLRKVGQLFVIESAIDPIA